MVEQDGGPLVDALSWGWRGGGGGGQEGKGEPAAGRHRGFVVAVGKRHGKRKERDWELLFLCLGHGVLCAAVASGVGQRGGFDLRLRTRMPKRERTRMKPRHTNRPRHILRPSVGRVYAGWERSLAWHID